MADFSLKAHDRLPSIQATLKNPDGSLLDLTGATSVKFIMKLKDAPGTVKVNAAAVVVAPATGGIVRYDWLAIDTDAVGSYQAEWEITWTGGKKQTVPTTSYHTIDVLADLDNL